MRILCGTCAWADHQNFYPASVRPQERLAYYARFFPLVEIDSSYYRIPEPRHALAWARSTPDGFVFDLKAHRTLTLHDGPLDAARLDHDATAMRQVAHVLHSEGKLGAILFQFPPWFVQSDAAFVYLARLREWFAGYLVAVEFRHRSWWKDESTAEHTLAALREHSFVNVVCDEPQTGMGTIPFIPAITLEDAVIFRLHGRNEQAWYQKGLTSSQQRFDYKYSVGELQSFLPFVKQWCQSAKSIHILMNNNQSDYAVSNALDWLSILGLEQQQRPDPPSEQLRLFDGWE